VKKLAEFDIRIGTLLDTRKAEQQLQEFINKHKNEENLDLKLDFKGEEDLKELGKSLQTIIKFAKSIENIKINVDTDSVSGIETSVGDSIKKNAQELGQATQEAKKQIGNTVKENLGDFDTQLSNIKKKLGNTLDELQQMKLDPNANVGEINKLQDKLKALADVDFSKFGKLGLQLVDEEINGVIGKFSELYTMARNNQLNNVFQDVKVAPLMNQLEALKEVLNFKGLDTSGIDDLITKLKSTSKYATDLRKASSIVREVTKDFGNMKSNLKMNDIKSSEAAIKKLLSYREELLKQIPFEIDTTKVEKAQQEVKRIDEAIERLSKNSDKSLVKNLIDLSELKNMENMENATEILHKNVDKLGGAFDKLKQQVNQVGKMEFVDISKMANLQSMIKEIDNSMEKLSTGEVNIEGIVETERKLKNLEDAIKDTKQVAESTKLEMKFNADFDEVVQQLNGLHSAIIKMDISKDGLEDVEEYLDNIKNLAKVDLDKAITELKTFSNEMKDTAKSMNLGDISGGMSQFTKYVNDLVSLTKQLSKTKDINIAKGIKEEIDKTLSAIDKLKDGFDDVQKDFAKGFLDDAMKGLGQGFTQEIEKINTEAEKLRVVLYRLSTMEMSEGMAKGLAEEFERAADKVSDLQNALKRALSGTDSVDASGIVKLREELEQAKQSMVELGKKKIELDCQETIARVEKLKNEVENLDDVLNKLGGVDAISRIKEDFENGAMSVEKATSALKKYNDTLDKVENNSKQINKSFDAFESAGSKIEGVFSAIKDGFQRFTIPELLEEGIENAIYGIKETIMGLDAAMTELKRVAPDSLKFDDVGYKQIANDAREVAMSVGQSTEDVITGMSTALQAGASTMQQATEIARSSAMLQNVSDMSADAASQAIASMVNQYYSMDTALGKVQDKIKGAPKDYNNLTNAIDMVNYAGNNWAISTEGVTQALQNGGSVLSSYGVTLSDSIAMISSANESMQDPSRIGNGLRSLAINFAGIKTNAKEGTIEMNKSAKALREIAGIDIFTDKSKTSVKDMMTLMDEIYDKWDGLTDVQQKGLSEGLAGKTQAAVFQSLMNGWSRVRQFQNEYKEGMMVGSAEKENAAYLDSIAGKWNKLKEAMKSLVTNNVSQSFIKGLLDGATKLVQVIEKIMNSLGSIGTGGVLLGIASFIKTMANFKDFSGLTGMAKAISTIFTSVKGGSGVFSGIVTGLKSLVTGAGAAKMGMVALNAVLTGLGWAAVVAGITLAVKALDDYIVTTKEAINAAKDKQQAARDEISSLNSQKSSLSTIAQEYDTLAKKTNKTAEEMDRFRELKQQIAQISPDLVAGYDSNNDPILKLNGSLSSYIGELDVAIAKQKQLFYEGQAEEADARMKDNEKKSVKQNRQNNYVNAKDLINNQRNELFNASQLNAFGQTVLANEAKTAEEMAKIRQKYRDTQTKYEKQYLEKLSKDRQTINENDLAIQSKYIADFLENSKLSDGQESMFSGFMENLNWGTLGEEQADILSSGLEKLSAKTAFVTSDMKGFESQIESAKAKFKDTNAINAYGKSLQEIADKSGKFDLQSWSGYMDEVNTRFENGALNVDQYRYSMGILADTVSELSGIDKGIVLESLVQTGDIESALKVATDGLNNFMKGYGKSVNDLKNGDSLAIELEKQYKAISDLGKTMETKAIEGKFTADFVLEAAKDQDLPSQMREIMNAFARDGEVTEIEQKVLMNIQAEIQDKGKLTGETLREVEDLLNGNFDNLKIDGKIMFNGLELSVEEAEALQKALEYAGMTAESIKMGDTGLENAMKQADAYRKALEGINNVEVRTEISKNGLLDTAKEVDTVVKALESIPKEQQVQFISDTAQYFDGAESVQDAINSMPDVVKLKYNIGVEGDTKLTEVKSKIDALPEQVRAEVYAETYNLSEVDKLTQVVNEFGKTNATALLTLEGAGEVMHQATSTKEMLQGFQNLVYNSTLEVEVKDQLLQALEKELNELEGKETKTNVTVEEKGAKETKSEVKGVSEEVEKTNGKKATVEVEAKTEQAEEKLDNVNKEVEKTNEEKAEFNVDVNDEAFKVKMKQINDELESADTLEANPKVDVKGVEESKQKVEDTNEAIEKYKGTGGTAHLDADNSVANRKILESQKYKDDFTKNAAGNVTVNVNGTEKLKVAIGEKGQLEKDGSSVTSITLNGSEQLEVAINEKGQLEVNGVARTDIDLNGAEELQFAINDKGELEVNGQAVTDIKVNGKGELEDVKGTLDGLEEEKSVNVSFNVNQALDSIMSRLGLTKQKETIEITVNCKDNASPTLEKINSFKDKNVTITITCNNGQQVESQVKNISNTKIANKQFTISANASSATTTVNTLANKNIPTKTFAINCTDNATSKINNLANKKIPTKTFTVNCKDGATSTVNKIANTKITNKKFNIDATDNAMKKLDAVIKRTISNKSFTVSCVDRASSKLTNIASKLRGIVSKTVTVTARYSTIGKPPKGVNASVSKPQVVDTQTPIIVNNSADVTTLASTQENLTSVRNAMASVQARYTDTVNTGNWWVNESLDHDIDLLKDFNAQLEKTNSQLDLVSQQAEMAFGKEKARLIQTEINLLSQKYEMLQLEQSKYQSINSSLKDLLRQQGFNIDSNGAVTNSTNKILELEHALESAKKAQDAYTGDNEAHKKSLQNTYDSVNDKLQKAKETLDEYYETSTKIDETAKDWASISKEIEELKMTLYEANEEARNFYTNAKIKDLEYAYDELADKIDLVNSKMEHKTGHDKINLLKEELGLLEQQRIKNEELQRQNQQQQQYYKEFLSGKGFAFDSEGDITNGADALNWNVNSNEYESILDAYNKYMETQHDTLPDLAKEWQDLQNSQIDVRKEIEETKDELDELNKTKALDFLDELTQKQEVLSNKLAELDGRLELVSFGTRGDVLREQVGIIEEQIKLLERTNVELERQQAYLRQSMSSDGFRFDNNGDISNLDSLLALAKTKDEYDKLKEKAEEYYETQNSISEGKAEWYEYRKELQDTQDEIANLKYELKDLLHENNIRDLTNEITVLQNELDKLDAMQDLNGKNSIEIYKQQEELINKQKDATQDLLDAQMKRKDELANELISYGFSINDDGTIDNTANKLADLKELLSEDEFGRVEGFLDDYFETSLEEIPELEKQLIDYQVQYEEVIKSKLDATKKIEEEITKIYEKQIDERIEKIEEERDSQIESLNKAKDAYSNWRKEVDYNDDYDEQLQKVQDLQAKIEIAKRDDSLSGKKRLEDLMKELSEEQKTLEELVQNKIDEDINNMFDEKQEQIEQNAEDKIKDLEDTFSEAKIAELVSEAIQTGIFEDIDGNITSLDDALMNFANNSAEYLGVMGETLKLELLDNLNVALETMQQLNEINRELGNNKSSLTEGIAKMPLIDVRKTTDLNYSNGLDRIANNNVSIGDMVITVQGNATEKTVDDIKEILEEYTNKIKHDIMINVK
jgi:DNA repair exonuclease SbcCD ATPase subunit